MMKLQRISSLKLLCLIIWQASCYIPGTGAKGDFCANPIPPNNPLDVKWADQHAKDGWNVQFGNPTLRNLFTRLMTGIAEDNKDHDHSKICLKLNFNFAGGIFNGFYSGYGDKRSYFDCTPGVACTYKSHDQLSNETIQAHVSYFDDKEDHNLMACIFCFANGKVGWSAFTRSKTISDEELKTIKDHFKDIGFNQDEGVLYHTPTC